jgi:enduracididine biosynthesis enzyme MppP
VNTEGGNLTQIADLAIGGAMNVSDAHPRHRPSAGQRQIIDGLPALFEEARTRPADEVEERAHQAFFTALGQRGALSGRRILNAYASSVAMDVVARWLASRTNALALIHPTFDNIPDLLRAWSLNLVPVEEDELVHGELSVLEHVGALFVTTPNNPTGVVVNERRLAEIAEACRRHDSVLVLDTSFRGFDRRAQYDSYVVLDASGVEYIVIEDTGKLWPMLELKLGFMVASAHVHRELADALSDIALNVSPFVLSVVGRLADDAASGGFDELHRLIEGNRQALKQALHGSAARLLDHDTRVSVARVGFPADTYANDVERALRTHGLHVFPGDRFHWARPWEGDHWVRVALTRDAEVVTAAGRMLAQHVAGPRRSSHVGRVPEREDLSQAV